MSAPSHGTKMSRIAQPALPQPLSELSRKRSRMQRNQTTSAAIQMKNQKLHSSTCPKLVVMESMKFPLASEPGGLDDRRTQSPRRSQPSVHIHSGVSEPLAEGSKIQPGLTCRPLPSVGPTRLSPPSGAAVAGEA